MAIAQALTISELKSQMKDIADHCIDIGVDQFASYDELELFGMVRDHTGTILFLEPPVFRIGDTTTSHFVEYMKISFSIYKITEQGNYNLNSALISDCKTIAMKVMSRIKANSYSYTGTRPAPWRHLHIGSITGSPAQTPIADGRIGFTIDFEIDYQISLAYVAEDWDD